MFEISPSWFLFPVFRLLFPVRLFFPSGRLLSALLFLIQCLISVLLSIPSSSLADTPPIERKEDFAVLDRCDNFGRCWLFERNSITVKYFGMVQGANYLFIIFRDASYIRVLLEIWDEIQPQQKSKEGNLIWEGSCLK